MMARVPNTLTQRDKVLHAQQRRVLSRGFSDIALRAYEELIDSHVKIFCHQIGRDEKNGSSQDRDDPSSQWSKPRNMAHYCK